MHYAERSLIFAKTEVEKYLWKNLIYISFFSRITKEEIHGWKENDFAGLFFVRIKTMDKFIVRALTNGRSQICGAGRSYFLFRVALMLCIFIYVPQQALVVSFVRFFSWHILLCITSRLSTYVVNAHARFILCILRMCFADAFVYVCRCAFGKPSAFLVYVFRCVFSYFCDAHNLGCTTFVCYP